MIFYVYRLNVFRNFALISKGFDNIHKIKNQMTYILYGIILQQSFDAILSMLGLLVAEIQVIL